MAGIMESVLVTHNSKNSIEIHGDTSFELESMLEMPVQASIIGSSAVRFVPKMSGLCLCVWDEAKGLDHAIMCALPCCPDI